MPNLISSQSLSPDFKTDRIERKGKYNLYPSSLLDSDTNERFYIWKDQKELNLKIVDISRLHKFKTVAYAGLIEAEYHGLNGYQVKLTRSFASQSGWMSMIFNSLILEQGHLVYSDKTHTLPGSMNFWQGLAKNPLIQIDTIDLSTNTITPYYQCQPTDIWGVGEEMKQNGRFSLPTINLLHQYRLISSELHQYATSNINQIGGRNHIILKATKK